VVVYLIVAMVLLFVSLDDPQSRKAKQFVECTYTRNDGMSSLESIVQ
jgi:hypothetical protein